MEGDDEDNFYDDDFNEEFPIKNDHKDSPDKQHASTQSVSKVREE